MGKASGTVHDVPAVLLDGDLPSDLARILKSQAWVAVDTETSGLSWVTDRLDLCQVFSPATGPLLLRRVEEVPRELAALMADGKVVKVFHHAPFDLRFLESKWGIRTTSIACTKAASKLLNPALPSSGHSLQSLLDRYLGVSLTKGKVRTSNWSAPTLSGEQVAYATADVIHLLDLHKLMRVRLEAAGLLDTWTQICAYMPIDAHLEVTGVPNPLVY